MHEVYLPILLREIVGDAMLFTLQNEPSRSTISNLQN